MTRPPRPSAPSPRRLRRRPAAASASTAAAVRRRLRRRHRRRRHRHRRRRRRRRRRRLRRRRRHHRRRLRHRRGRTAAPTPVNDTGSQGRCTVRFYNVVANDTDPDGHYPLTLVSVTGIGFAVESATTLAFSSLNFGRTGTYTVRDSLGASATATLTVTVAGGTCTVQEPLQQPLPDRRTSRPQPGPESGDGAVKRSPHLLRALAAVAAALLAAPGRGPGASWSTRRPRSS